MFANLIRTITDSVEIDLVLVSSESRKTNRSSADGVYRISIAHQESNENPGFITQRSTVRLSQLSQVAESDATVTPYVQFTMSVPKGQFTPELAQALSARLVNFLVNSENTSAVAVADAAEMLAVARLYTGEP